jgi:hypothetical protein
MAGSGIWVMRWLWRWRLTTATAVVLLAVVVTGLVLLFVQPSPQPAWVATLPADGRMSAALVIAGATDQLSVGAGDLGSALVRASVPPGATVRPELTRNGRVLLTLVPSGGHATGYQVRVMLSSAVAWSLDFDGGTRRTAVDLRGAKVRGVRFGAGSDVIDLAMPAPSGTTTIGVANGAGQFMLRLPAGIPAQVTASAGAGELTIDAVSRTGVAGGTVVTPPGWTAAARRFSVDASSGVDVLSLSRW